MKERNRIGGASVPASYLVGFAEKEIKDVEKEKQERIKFFNKYPDLHRSVLGYIFLQYNSGRLRLSKYADIEIVLYKCMKAVVEILDESDL